MDTTALSKVVEAYLTIFSFGHAATVGMALNLLRNLLLIELIVMGLWWAISEDNYAGVALSKILTAGFLLWLITQWPTLMVTLRESFIAVGLRAGGSALTAADVRSPGNIFSYGAQVYMILLESVLSVSGWDALWSLPRTLVMLPLLYAIVIAFAWLTLQLMIALVEFYFAATMVVILLPFGVFRPLAFLCEKAIGAILAHGFKLCFLVFIASVAQPVLTVLSLPSNPTPGQCISFIVAIAFQVWFGIKGPGMAVGLLAGSPTLTASDALRTAVATGAQAGLIATGAGAAAGSALRGGQAAMQMARNVNGAYQMAGMPGVARLAGTSSRELAANTVRRFTQPQRAPLGMQVSRMIPHD